ncbi:Rieske 2Fe-2S domain-containing protein [Dasania marina]|uniref:Rieske 2Fe-2S domain-containing protein n=1 Tax=Dasania marina TaxID=471499 RepID=UPI0030DCB0C2
MLDAAHKKWFPIASSNDLPFRHSYHGQLLGREFAVWRADDGYVNVWENRCLHRGVRLSIGINDGRELKCQYHGWRYSSRTAGCTYIPAHPADAPARTICNNTYPAVERYGLIWSGEAPVGELPEVAELEEGMAFVLRAIAVDAPAEKVIEKLRHYRFQPSSKLKGENAQITINELDSSTIYINATDGQFATGVVFFVQPIDSHRTVIRGVLCEEPDDCQALDVLTYHNQLLSMLRNKIEAGIDKLLVVEPMQPDIKLLSAELASVPIGSSADSRTEIRVQVARKWKAAEGISGFELVAITGQLPTFQPGAHIDVQMPNGITRQYSLTNGPGETQSYTIGVKLEPNSKGGSICMHEQVREGDVLVISAPRNNFPLRRDAIKTILIAGGIGITPLLSMARTLHHSGLSHELHYFCQSKEHMAFPKIIEEISSSLFPQLSLNPEQTAIKISGLLENYQSDMHLYVCGPGPMLEVTREIAHKFGWPDQSIHFEYFKNTHEIDDSSSFEVELARSGMTLQVPAGKTILEVARENGVDVPSSCEQGACGTCIATVLEGEPDHQDVYLSESEKNSGKCLMTCVSRAKSVRLVIDL